VVPEVVAHGGESGAATGVNYSALVGVLVEAVKEQQIELNRKQVQLDRLLTGMQQQQEAMTKQQEINAQLIAEINRLKTRDMITQR
jgi:hypothetical protein